MSSADQDVTAESSTAEVQDVSAESSPASGEKSLHDFVSEKVRGSEDSPPSESGDDAPPEAPKSAKPEAEDGKAAEKLSDEVPPEELAQYKGKTRQRVQELLDARNDARAETERLKPKAEQWDRVERFIGENNVSAEEASNALQITALINNDPAKAFQVLTPIYQELAKRAGMLLPEDLETEVRSGAISRERAVELSRARASQQTTEQRVTRDTERRRQQDEQRRHADLQQTLKTASQSWDANRQAKDPDWHLKRDEVARRVEARFMKDGLPSDANRLLGILDEEVKAVEAFMKSFSPKPTRKDPVTALASPRGGSMPTDAKDIHDFVRRRIGA